MRVITGKVVAGKVVVEGELLRASAEAERGYLVDGGEALATLGRT